MSERFSTLSALATYVISSLREYHQSKQCDDPEWISITALHGLFHIHLDHTYQDILIALRTFAQGQVEICRSPTVCVFGYAKTPPTVYLLRLTADGLARTCVLPRRMQGENVTPVKDDREPIVRVKKLRIDPKT